MPGPLLRTVYPVSETRYAVSEGRSSVFDSIHRFRTDSNVTGMSDSLTYWTLLPHRDGFEGLKLHYVPRSTKRYAHSARLRMSS